MPRADFVTSIVVILLGVGALVQSWRMPRFENLQIEPYTVPGIVPGVLSIVLIVLGGVLLARSSLRRGWRIDPRDVVRHLKGATSKRLYLGLVLTLGYAAGLVGRVPFWLATVVFVAAFIVVFETDAAAGAWRRRWATAVLQAIIVAVAVTAVFQLVFLVRLP